MYLSNRLSIFVVKKVTEDIDFLARIKTIDYSGGLLFVYVCLVIRLVRVGEDNVGSEFLSPQ